MAEHWIVVPGVVGSSPITHPRQRRGSGLPRSPLSFHSGASPSGKARDFDSLIRWFESSRPSHRGVVDPGIVSFHARRRSGKSAATRWISSEAERMFRKHQVGISEFPSSSRGESLNAGWSPRDVVGSTYPGATAAFRGSLFMCKCYWKLHTQHAFRPHCE